jgi:class 3 adenylate cyclase
MSELKRYEMVDGMRRDAGARELDPWSYPHGVTESDHRSALVTVVFIDVEGSTALRRSS